MLLKGEFLVLPREFSLAIERLLVSERKQANAKVDFVIRRGMEIIPIEVNTGKAGQLKSLRQLFMKKSEPLCAF